MSVDESDGTLCRLTTCGTGVDVFVRERGSGFPLLMLNGIGANTEMWGPAETALGRTSRTIVFDAPGTGRSSMPLYPLPIATLARFARDLCRSLGHKQFDVLGFSFGGLIAQQLAYLAPEQVRRLALVATSCGAGSTMGDPWAVATVATPARYYWPAFQPLAESILGGRRVEPGGRLDEARLRYPPSLVGYGYQMFAASTWSSLPWLAEVETPTLVLASDDDRLVPPANGEQLARLLPRSRLHVLAGEGHLGLFAEGSALHGLLRDFFAARTPTAARAWRSGIALGEIRTAA